MIEDVYHIAYLTDDIEAAKTMYTTIFDAEVVRESFNSTTGMKAAYVKLGGTMVEIQEPTDKTVLGGRTGLILDHIGYVVPNIEDAMQQYAAKGVGFATAEPVVNPEGARLIYLDAPALLGVRVHLTERPQT
jgi:methylmalonyl-CoA/ethylmalonyl-CoA epimerase